MTELTFNPRDLIYLLVPPGYIGPGGNCHLESVLVRVRNILLKDMGLLKEEHG
jgi:hypothetical protein